MAGNGVQYMPTGDESFDTGGQSHTGDPKTTRRSKKLWRVVVVNVTIILGLLSFLGLVILTAVELKNRELPNIADLLAPGFANVPLDRAIRSQACDITDAIPSYLVGQTVYRNTPAYYLDGANAHWFTGLAMLHSFVVVGTKDVRYSSQYVKSTEYNETAHNTTRPGPISPNTVVTIRKINGHTLTSTATLAVNEFHPGTLDTISAPFAFNDSFPNTLAPEHGAYDANGNFFHFYAVFDSFGRPVGNQIYSIAKGSEQRVLATSVTPFQWPTDGPNYVHHFSVTARYLVVSESPAFWPRSFDVNFWREFTWKPEYGTKIRVIDRVTGLVVATFPAQWAAHPAWFSFHHVNAWEDGEHSLIIDLIAYPSLDVLPALYLRQIMNKTSTFTHDTLAQSRLLRFVLPTATPGEKVTALELSSRPLELPSINPAYVGRAYRFVWGVSQCDAATVFYDCLVKIDTQLDSGSRLWSPFRQFPSEPLFIASTAAGAGEDTGSVASVILDGPAGGSYFGVLDASGMTLQAKAKLADKLVVPLGFHGAIYATPKL